MNDKKKEIIYSRDTSRFAGLEGIQNIKTQSLKRQTAKVSAKV